MNVRAAGKGFGGLENEKEGGRVAGEHAVRSGTFANGMEFLTWGQGPKTLLSLPGGPGSSLPGGMTLRMAGRWFQPFVQAGYAVWYVTRRRSMREGLSVAGIADDHASVIREAFGGRVDLVLGTSYGGMIGQYLAARHGERLGALALVAAAAEVSDWGKQVDFRLAAALERGDTAGVGAVFAEYAMPGERSRPVRRLLGPWIGRNLLSGKHYPPGDLLVEVEAEIAFDSRPVLPGIGVPVVLVCGDRDRFFPAGVVEQTARLIPRCTLVWYEGQGHMRTASSRRVAHDVLAPANRALRGGVRAVPSVVKGARPRVPTELVRVCVPGGRIALALVTLAVKG